MSQHNVHRNMSNADLLLFDDLIAKPSQSTRPAAPVPTGAYANASQPQATADWFSLLSNNSTTTYDNVPAVVSPIAASPVKTSSPPGLQPGNYSLARNLFQTSSLTATPLPASTIPVPDLIQPSKLTTSGSDPVINSNDFGNFVEIKANQPSGNVRSSHATSSPMPFQKVTAPTQHSADAQGRTQQGSVLNSFLTIAKPPVNLAKSTFTSHSPAKPISPIKPVGSVHAPISPPLLPPPQQHINPRAAGYGGVNAPPLRFGQHLEAGTNGRQYLNPQVQDSFQNNGHSHARTTSAHEVQRINPLAPETVKKDEEFEPWPDFETSPASTPVPIATPPRPAVPNSEVLLSLFQSNLFPLPLPLFQELGPLPFPLKRRVLSQQKTKRFFAALLAGAEVAIRICAGRKRRGGRFEADREARECARVWKSLRERIAGVGMRDLPNLDASFTFRDYPGEPSDLCIVCGVARHEKVRGCVGQTGWDFENGGHTTCIRWWVREKALLES
ncbi:hypothetical protein V1512DRAFT_230130 [Lipomyces arxii]|uniref:uncharacterized protein n=1 Tax=Lipomyces arxii TaxID=56418 RepID=UPI0034CD6F0E